MTGLSPGAPPGAAESCERPAGQGTSSTAGLLALLLLLAVVPYINSLQNGFVYDDNNEVLTNPYIRSFGHVGDIFSTRILAHLGARGATNYYRPISILGFLLCYKLFGLLPYGFHLANLLLHVLMVCLLFGLTKQLFQNLWLGFVAAAAFALHPIHTESVAWVSAVTDLELAVFYLAAFWFFLGSAKPHGTRSELAQLGMAGSFVLALLSKEAAVTLPLVATVYEHFYRDDRETTTPRQKLARYGVLWLLVVAYVLFRIRFFGAFAPVLLTLHVSWYEAILSGFALAGEYLWKVLWPVHLSAYYAFHKSVSLLDPRVLVGAAALGLCVVAWGALWKRSRPISFGIVWFFLTLAPVLNSRWLGPNVFTERYLYLPSVGFCWVAAWGILRIRAQAAGRRPAWGAALGIVLGVVGVLAAVRIVTRNRDWRDEITYYRATLAAEPEAAGLRINLGAVYWNHMQPDAAEREWRAALPTSPHSALLLNNLGLVYARKKQYGDAVDCFQRSMRLRPNFTDAHLNLGRVEEETGKIPEAELQLRAAAVLAPLSVQTRNELGQFYFAHGRWREAEEQFRASVASIANTTAYDGIGDTYVRLGRRDVAEQAYREALALDDADSHAHFGLAAILASTGREGEALAHYQAGLRLDPLNPEARSAFDRLKSNLSHVNPSNK
jgi:tetratricopeptide (TPR) repeat protein